MQIIQLYIKDIDGDLERIDMFEDESVEITQTIRNVKDVGKVFTTFTKQFTVPASKNNNKLFRHYYNFDVQNGFDARIRKFARIELNSLPFKDGRLRMDGVDMKNNKAFAYRLTFFGSIVELKDILGEDKLTDLTSLNIEMPFTPDEVYANLKTLNANDVDGNAVTGVSLPLITSSQRLYYNSGIESEQSGNLYAGGSTSQGVKFNDLKYAVKLSKVIEAIETQYTTSNGYLGNIEFTSNSFFKTSTTDFSKLYVWCHRKKGRTELAPQTPVSYDFTTGPHVSDGVYTMTPDTDYDVRQIYIISTVTSGDELAQYSILLYVNGSLHQRFDNLTGTASSYVNLGDSFNPDDEVSIEIQGYGTDVTFISIQMKVGYWEELQDESSNYYEDVVSGGTNFTVSAASTGYSFNIQEQMPEITIIDFLSSIFKMFNLGAYVNDFGKIEVETLDDYYTTTEHNISKYVDITTSTVDSALPYKEIQFKYADTKSILAEQPYQDIANIEWGGIEYNNSETLDGDIYKVLPNFHHAKYETLLDSFDLTTNTGIMYGYFVDDNEDEYIGKPLIMYINPKTANVAMKLLSGTSSVAISPPDTINMPSNTEVINDATSNNIHFDSEKSEYTGVEATASLFERYYKNFIVNVFNPRSRLTKVKAVLPIGQIIKIQLSDIVVIGTRKYRINSMKSNLRDGRTDFELINYYG